MSRIRDITFLPVAHTLEHPYGTARGVVAARRAGLVLLHTEDGIQGLGEATGPANVIAAYLDLVKPHFLGTSVFAQRGVAQAILASPDHRSLPGPLLALLGGIDIAAHDAIGKLLGVSVADLIGGCQHERLPVYASGGYFTSGDDQEAALAAQLEPLHGSAFSAVMIRLGRSPEEDLWRVRMARRLAGEAKLLLVDAGGTYSADAALDSMRRIAPFGIHWFGEPLGPQDWGGYAELARRAPMGVATGAALHTVSDLRRVVDGRLAAVLQPDLSRCGGFETARTVAALAAIEHLRLSPRGWSTGIGLAATLHWAASLPAPPPLVEYDVGHNPLRDDLLAEPLRLRGGMLALPSGPGLGIQLAPDALARFGGS